MIAPCAHDRFRKVGDVPTEVTHTMLQFHSIARALLFAQLSGEQLPSVFPGCHGLSRAYAMVFPHLEVCDGIVILCNEGGLLPGHHSWLRFRRYNDFGVDVAPCGALPFMTFPNLIYFDRFAPFHRYHESSPEVTRKAEESAKEFFAVLEPLAKKYVL